MSIFAFYLSLIKKYSTTKLSPQYRHENVKFNRNYTKSSYKILISSKIISYKNIYLISLDI